MDLCVLVDSCGIFLLPEAFFLCIYLLDNSCLEVVLICIFYFVFFGTCLGVALSFDVSIDLLEWLVDLL